MERWKKDESSDKRWQSWCSVYLQWIHFLLTSLTTPRIRGSSKRHAQRVVFLFQLAVIKSIRCLDGRFSILRRHESLEIALLFLRLCFWHNTKSSRQISDSPLTRASSAECTNIYTDHIFRDICSVVLCTTLFPRQINPFHLISTFLIK